MALQDNNSSTSCSSSYHVQDLKEPLCLHLSSERSYTGQQRCLLPKRDTKGWSKLASVTFGVWRPEPATNLTGLVHLVKS